MFSKFSDKRLRHFYRGVPPGLKLFLQKINYFPGINRTQVSRDLAAFIDYHYTWLIPTKETVSALTSTSLYQQENPDFIYFKQRAAPPLQ